MQSAAFSFLLLSDMWHIFAVDPVWAIAIAVVAGLWVGCFLSVLAHRLPRMMERDWQQHIQTYLQTDCPECVQQADKPTQKYGLFHPGWHCRLCDASVRSWRWLPVVGWLLARGRCDHCQGPIGYRYLVTELLTGALFGLSVWRFGVSVMALYAMLFCSALVVLAWIDLQTSLLPDVITLPLMWAGLLVNLNDVFASLPMAVLGAAVGYLFLWCLFHLFRFLTGRDGMGYGDFKLLAALGAWLGCASLPVILVVSSLTGIVGTLYLQGTGRAKRGDALPFGPYLALAGLVVLFAPSGWLSWLR